ncbi:MAG: pyrimidine utilization protein D [Pseudomonadota bacterium]
MPEAAGLYFEQHGRSDAPPLILSSGLGGSASYWAPNIPALAEHFRVIAYDHRGTGRSDRALPDVVKVDDFADDILLLMNALHIRTAHLVGHAAGGVAGLNLALKAPERLKSLVAINSWSKADPHFLRCFEARLNLLRHAGVEAFLRAQPIFLYPPDWISEHTTELDTELPHQLADFPGVETMEKRIAALAAFDIDDRLDEISSNVFLISGGLDMLVPPRCSGRLANGIAHAWHQQLSFEGHALNVTAPDDFDEMVMNYFGG